MQVSKLLRETIDLEGFRIADVEKEDNVLIAMIERDGRYALRCGSCGERARYRDKRFERSFRHVPLWGIPVNLRYTPCRVDCESCGIRQERMPWTAGQKKRMTHALACTLAMWVRKVTIAEAARMFRCSWNTVSDALEYVVEYGLRHRDLSGIKHIGVDEISQRRGHVYLTNVYDLDTSTLIWSGPGRSKETLRAFFEWFGPERAARLEGVCCDMWQPYIAMIKEHAPDAILVFDKFHVAQHLSRAVDQVRRNEIRAKGKAHKEVVAGARYVFLKNPENLTGNQRKSLGFFMKLNLQITKAYLLKEAFRKFWQYTRPGWAENYLEKWFWWATHSRLKPMRDFAWMLRRHQKNILAYFKLRMTNAGSEGMNNKAKAISHRAYGFRTPKYFILNMYHCLGRLPEPQLTHTFL